MPTTKRQWIDHLQSIIAQIGTASDLCPYCAEEEPYQCLWCAPLYLAADALTNQALLMERHTDVDSHRDDRAAPVLVHGTPQSGHVRSPSDSTG
jgi:hypothetical protein